MTSASLPTQAQYGQIILFGDSLTERCTDTSSGFALQPTLQQHYLRRLDVVNRGLSGYNSAHAVAALARALPSPSQAPMRLLVIFFGANDACTPSNASRQHVPLASYRHNLRVLATHALVRAHAARVVIVTPPPVDERMLLEHGFEPGGRSARDTAAYAAAARDVAAELEGVACCDLWADIMRRVAGTECPPEPVPGDSRAPRNEALARLLADGLHFTPDAYEVWWAALRETLERNFYPELDPQHMQSVLPPWGEAPKAG